MDNNQHCGLDGTTGFILHCHNNFLCLSKQRRFTVCFLKSFIQKWYLYAAYHYCTSSCGWKIEKEGMNWSSWAILPFNTKYSITEIQILHICKKYGLHLCVLDFKRSIWFAFASLPILYVFNRFSCAWSGPGLVHHRPGGS